MREKIEVSTRRTAQNAIECTTIAGGQYFHFQYFFYSKREAVKLFRAWVKSQLAK